MKGIQEVMTLKNIHTIHSAGIRSIPRNISSSYLLLYMLKIEEHRLMKEVRMAERIIRSAQNKLVSIHSQMKTLQEDILLDMSHINN